MNADSDIDESVLNSAAIPDKDDDEDDTGGSSQRQKILMAQIYDQTLEREDDLQTSDHFHELESATSQAIMEQLVTSKNSSAIEEMDAAIDSIRAWQKRREKQQELSKDQLLLEEISEHDFPETDETIGGFSRKYSIPTVGDEFLESAWKLDDREVKERERSLASLQSLLASPRPTENQPAVQAYLKAMSSGSNEVSKGNFYMSKDGDRSEGVAMADEFDIDSQVPI